MPRLAARFTVGMAVHGAPDNVNTFTLSLDGALLSTPTCHQAPTASYAWNTTTATVGGHQLTLTVRDHLDRTATTFINVTVGQH